MKTILSLLILSAFLFQGRADEHAAILNYQIIALRSDGFGQRVLIPFSGHINNGGLRLWECIAEPFYAEGEDETLLKDINLFSLCGIKITVNRPERNPAELSINFTDMAVPKGTVISKRDIIDALFYCIVKTSFVHTLEKPKVSIKYPSEDKDLYEAAKAAYDSPDFGHVKGDKGHSTPKINQENSPN